jgi:MFS family permease
VRSYGGGFALLLVVSTLGTLSNGAITPVLPRFVREELGGDETLVGLVMGAAFLCSLCSGLLAGPQVDRAGRRITAVVGLSIVVSGALLLLVADSAPLMILARVVFGIGGGITATAIITWAVDQVPAARRGRALSVYGLTVWIGLSAGPQLGQAIFDAWGYRAVWVSVVALELLALAVAAAGREVARPVGAPRPRSRRRLVPEGAARPGLAIGLAAYGEGVITALLVLHLVDRGVHDGAGIGGAASVFTIFAASVLVFRIAGARLVDRHRPETVAAVALGIEAVGLTVLAFSSSFGVAAAGAALMGAGFAVLFPSLALVATRETHDQERGAALGSFGSSFSLGLALGALLGGVVATIGGTGAAHLSGAVAAVAGALVLIAGGPDRRPPAAVLEGSDAERRTNVPAVG